MINWINANLDRHIITMEDPVEFYHKHKKSIVVQREVGVDGADHHEAAQEKHQQVSRAVALADSGVPHRGEHRQQHYPTAGGQDVDAARRHAESLSL